MGAFWLDVDPDALDAAADGLLDLGHHLSMRAAQVSSTPGQVSESDWAGSARTVITAEMTALGKQLTGFASKFTAAGETLTGLAAAVRSAREVTLQNLNSRWDDAQASFQDAVKKADAAIPTPTTTAEERDKDLREAADRHAEARGVRESTERALSAEFSTLVSELQAAFTRASGALADATLVAVPDTTVAEFVRSRGSGTKAAWLTPARLPFPPELGARVLLGKHLATYDQKRALDDASRLSEIAERIQKASAYRSTRPPLPESEAAQYNQLMREHVDELNRLQEQSRISAPR